MSLLFEKIIHVDTIFFKARLWVDNTKDFSNNYWGKLTENAVQTIYLLQHDNPKLTDRIVAKHLVELLETINAVEVINKQTDRGTVVYKDWP